MKKLFSTAFASIGFASLAMSQVCLNPPINFGAFNTPFGIYSHDFNNDGNKDIAVSQNSQSLITLYYGNGNGTFGSSHNIPLSNSPAEIIGGDFNEDGKIDLAIAGGVNNVWIILANGSGGFNNPTSYSAALYPTSLCTNDFNNDGHLDLAVPNGNVANTISILLGSGNGTFSLPTNFLVGTCPCGTSCVKSADINSDGNIDLLVANQNSNDVSVLLGNGSGGFSAPANYGVGIWPWSLELADINNDTYTDIVTCNRNSNNVSILLGNSNGTFNLLANYPVGNWPTQLKVADYDLDGKLDIATCDKNSNQISVLKGTGSGTFNSANSYTTPDGPFALCNGDFNNDGKIDIATSNYVSTNASILINCNNHTAIQSSLCLPTITTNTPTLIGIDSVIVGGNITNDGGVSIVLRGVCYSINPNPNMGNSRTEEGSGIGSFTSTLRSLSPSTTYYARSYAKNSQGVVVYGNEVSFSTNTSNGFSSCGGVTDVDGNSYQTVQIGTQCWTQSNLKVSKYRNGDSIPTGLNNFAWQNTTIGAFAIYGNNPVNDGLYGKLYNHYAVMDIRGLCPTGWHVPTDSQWPTDGEWATLLTFLGGWSVAGGALKSTTTLPTPGGWVSPNTGATNSSGFTALPGGCRLYNGAFNSVGSYAAWWSSSLDGWSDAWYRILHYHDGGIYQNSPNRTYGFSVRCLRD